MDDFNGAKIALIIGDRLLVYQRDDFPGLRFAGMWDFPGGGRESDESPVECAFREVHEEFSIILQPSAVLWHREYISMHDPAAAAHFFVAQITQDQVDAIEFGEEGQRWALMRIDEVLSHEGFIPQLKDRFRDYLAGYRNES